ncbi:hypothetical protein COOONC_20277 [Cooperia oncophora]
MSLLRLLNTNIAQVPWRKTYEVVVESERRGPLNTKSQNPWRNFLNRMRQSKRKLQRSFTL